MQLSSRLEKILEMTGTGHCVADVGTDHGFVPIELVRRGCYIHALAMDVRTGPLERARDHIHTAGLETYIETRQSDGLAALAPGEADTIIIAGMGGHLIAGILDRGQETAQHAKRLVLSPHYDVEFFHHYLHENAYKVEDEQWVLDDNKLYVVINCQKQKPGEEKEHWQPEEWVYGKIPIQRKDPQALLRAERDKNSLEKLAEQLMTKPDNPRIRAKMDELKLQIVLAEEALRRMKS